MLQSLHSRTPDFWAAKSARRAQFRRAGATERARGYSTQLVCAKMTSARWSEWLVCTVLRLCARALQRLLPHGWSLGQRRPTSCLLPPGALSTPPPPLLQLPADVLHASILGALDERALCALASCCRSLASLVDGTAAWARLCDMHSVYTAEPGPHACRTALARHRLWHSPVRCRHSLRGHSQWVVSLACAGRRAVSGSDDGCIRVWDAEGGRCEGAFRAHDMPVVALAAAAARSERDPTGETGDGSGLEAEWVASGSGDMTIKVWRLSQG